MPAATALRSRCLRSPMALSAARLLSSARRACVTCVSLDWSCARADCDLVFLSWATSESRSAGKVSSNKKE